MVKFERITHDHLRYIADNMRDQDYNELIAAGHDDVYQVLIDSFDKSDMSTTVLYGDVPLAVLGVYRQNIVTGLGVPWLLSSKDALKHKRYFLGLTDQVITEMLGYCPKLYNYVHSENSLSIRWLKWMGFTIHTSDVHINEKTGARFYKFTMES